MKKKNSETIKNGVIIALVLILVFGASYFISELKGSNNNQSDTTTTTNDDSSSSIPDSEQGDLNDIDIDKYLSLKKADDASIIYIARPTCHYCQEEEPILRNVVYDFKITVNYLNTDELDDEGNSKLIKSDDYFSEGFGTPVLLIVKGDKIVDKLEGLTTKDKMVEFFKTNGFISE